ncbi:MAG TPA: SRPBCC domain-containing protein [Candidatus Thermoplasmatota archaeon]|nr:SRPBCC domain-containing protein [Candidatus Thermoplasmatota archaeon]
MDARELVSTRTFPHPPAALFAAFVEPERLARWWGPAGAVNVFHRFDPRPGGAWELTMTLHDGATHRMRKRFLEFDPPRRILVHHAQEGHDFTIAMEYEPVPGGSRLVWTTRFANAEQLAAVEKVFAAANEQNFDRLAAEMER